MSGLRSYATLAQIRARQGLAATDILDDARLFGKLRSATQEIERYTSRVFQPIQETRTFDWYSTTHLQFRSQEALTISQVVDGQGRTISTTAMLPLGGTGSTFGTSIGPFYGLEVIPASGDFFSYLTTKKRCIAVTGVWGFHDDYANAWHGSGVTVQDNPLSSSATTITTSANGGADVWGQTPALSAGHLIQIDTEWLHVTGITDGTHITVVRGVNGTTAASHAQGAAISVYEPPRDIQDICTRWAAFLYAQDSVDFTTSVLPTLGLKLPAGVPSDLLQSLDRYVKVRVA